MAMNGETLEYKNVYQENRGAMHEGRLQLLNEKVIFKNSKTGKVDTILHDDITEAIWRRVAKDFELKLVSKSGHLFKYDGFKEDEFAKLKDFLQDRYDVSLKEQELSAKGWNWGKTAFKGDEMQFDVGQKLSFEIPLSNVSQCTQAKDEVTLEFHQNDDSELMSLMEMRFYIPPSQDDEIDRVHEFHESVMAKADVLQVKGNAICIFHDMKFLTPRGHYDVRMYPKFIQLHGKTYDYKITYTSILRLFLLPHKDQRQIFFVVSLDPPLKQGQTRYHFLILLFYKETELSIELALSEEEIQEKFNGKLEKETSGPAFEVVSRVMKHLVQRKITVPGTFKGTNGSQSITCSYKASSGLLFPLERGFMYVIKPPIHIRFDEISFVNFARGAMNINKSFDFEIETRSKMTYIFSNIERDQYAALYDFVSNKKLKIKNIGKDGANYDTMHGSDDSDSEGAVHDPYMERMKQEAANRNEDGGDDDSESEDEDFNPEENGEEVAEEFDSNASASEDDDDEDGGNEAGDHGDDSGSDTKEKEPRKPAKRPKEKKEKVRRERKEEHQKPRKRAKKDPNAPKRPPTAFMWWMKDNRQRIIDENPGIGFTDVTKKAGIEWKTVSSETKQKYENMYKAASEEYKEKLAEYQASDAGKEMAMIKKAKLSSARKASSARPSKSKVGSSPKEGSMKFKSKEYIDPGDSSSDSSEDEKPPKAEKKKSSATSSSMPKAESSEEPEDDEVHSSSEDEKPVKKEEKKSSAKSSSKREKELVEVPEDDELGTEDEAEVTDDDEGDDDDDAASASEEDSD